MRGGGRREQQAFDIISSSSYFAWNASVLIFFFDYILRWQMRCYCAVLVISPAANKKLRTHSTASEIALRLPSICLPLLRIVVYYVSFAMLAYIGVYRHYGINWFKIKRDTKTHVPIHIERETVN